MPLEALSVPVWTAPFFRALARMKRQLPDAVRGYEEIEQRRIERYREELRAALASLA